MEFERVAGFASRHTDIFHAKFEHRDGYVTPRVGELGICFENSHGRTSVEHVSRNYVSIRSPPDESVTTRYNPLSPILKTDKKHHGPRGVTMVSERINLIYPENSKFRSFAVKEVASWKGLGRVTG